MAANTPHVVLQIIIVKHAYYCIDPITGSAVELHCCKAHSNITRKMENSTPCKMVTHENCICKLSTRDYVEEITYNTIFDVDRFNEGFSPNRSPFCDFYPVLSFFSSSKAQLEPRRQYSRFMAQMTWFGPRTVLLELGRWVTSFGKMCPKHSPKWGVNRHFKPNWQNLKIAVSPK